MTFLADIFGIYLVIDAACQIIEGTDVAFGYAVFPLQHLIGLNKDSVAIEFLVGNPCHFLPEVGGVVVFGIRILIVVLIFYKCHLADDISGYQGIVEGLEW